MEDLTKAEQYAVKAGRLLDDLLVDVTEAPNRSSYNKLSGTYSKTKKDLIREFKDNIGVYQAAYQLAGGKDNTVFDACKNIREPEEGNMLID